MAIQPTKVQSAPGYGLSCQLRKGSDLDKLYSPKKRALTEEERKEERAKRFKPPTP